MSEQSALDLQAPAFRRGVYDKALNQNGWLVVGHSEPQADMYQSFAARNFKAAVLYQKENSDTPQARIPSPTPTPMIPDTASLPSAPFARVLGSPTSATP